MQEVTKRDLERAEGLSFGRDVMVAFIARGLAREREEALEMAAEIASDSPYQAGVDIANAIRNLR